MTQPNLIKANGITLPAYGRNYSERTEFISREERAASGKLRRDITAIKKTFVLKYDAIDDADLNVFNELIEDCADKTLTLEVTYMNRPNTDNGPKTITRKYDVLIQPFDRERLLAVGAGLWGGVTVVFVEV